MATPGPERCTPYGKKQLPPTPDKPTAPGEGDLSGLIGNITVNCTNGKAAHELKTKGYTLISGS
ncbi:MAG: hypothetical protein ACLTR8_02785 [Oscillospiraceae bacterium]